MSRDDAKDLGLLALAGTSLTVMVLLARDRLRPLPLHRRVLVAAKRRLA